MALRGLQRVGNLRLYGGWWTTVRVLWMCPMFSSFCKVTHYQAEGRFHQQVCQTELSWIASAKFWSEFVVSPQRTMSTKITLLHPKTTVDINFPSWRVSHKRLLQRIIWMMPFHWMSFYLQFKVMDLCFIPSDDPWSKVFIFGLRMEEIWTHFFPHSFVSQLTLRGKQQAHIFSYPKASVMLFPLPLDSES